MTEETNVVPVRESIALAAPNADANAANAEQSEKSADENTSENAEKSAQNAPGNESDDNSPVVKSNFAKVQVEGFCGTYKDAKFDDEGVCERISLETLECLSKDFPGIKFVKGEEID